MPRTETCAYIPHKNATIAWEELEPVHATIEETEGGKVRCSACKRQLKREYLYHADWRYCPRCGAELVKI